MAAPPMPTSWPAEREPTFREWCHDVKVRRKHVESELAGPSGVCTLADVRAASRRQLAQVQPHDAAPVRRLQLRGGGVDGLVMRTVADEAEWAVVGLWRACESGGEAEVRAALRAVRHDASAIHWREDCLYGARSVVDLAVQRKCSWMLRLLCAHQGALEPLAECEAFTIALLHVATRGLAALLRIMIDAGVPFDARRDDAMKRTPLAWACWENRPECVRMLVRAGADPHGVDVYGKTAVYGACISTSTAALRVLLELGVAIPDVDAGHLGWTPLSKALMLTNPFPAAHATLLVRAGATIGLPPSGVHDVVTNDRVGALRWLLSYGARAEGPSDAPRYTPLQLAMVHRCAMPALLDTGAMRACACIQLLRGLARP